MLSRRLKRYHHQRSHRKRKLSYAYVPCECAWICMYGVGMVVVEIEK